VYIPGGPRAEAAHHALVLLGIEDPKMIDRLRAEIVRDPKTLVRHAGLFQGPLHGRAADPVIAKLLSSPDPELRYYAAYALMECRDPALTNAIAALAKEEATRTQAVAMYMAERMDHDGFKAIREELMHALVSADPAVKRAAVRAFATQKDMAVILVLRQYLAAPIIADEDVQTISQALNALTGSSFGFNPRANPQRTAAVLEQFDRWVRDHGGTPTTVNSLP
jgi:hypothetical protein